MNYKSCRAWAFNSPSTRERCDTRSVFKWSLTGLNSDFSFSKTGCLTKAKETSLLCYLLVAGGRIIWFILFLRALVLCEMQSVSSRVWARIAVSISYDDNHFTTGIPTWCWRVRSVLGNCKTHMLSSSLVMSEKTVLLEEPLPHFPLFSCHRWVDLFGWFL